VGVHNGRKFVSTPSARELTLSSAESHVEYVYKKPLKVSEYMLHDMVAVVLLVYANVQVGDAGAAASKMCIGWAYLVPLEAPRYSIYLLY
jgi:hypothetical protein